LSRSTERIGIAIPVLPCGSIDQQLAFYQALGFEVTYRQAKPNLYACVRHRVVELHFFVLKQLEPSNSYSMVYVNVPDVDEVYREFCDNLKQAFGKIPSKGFPRIGKLNDLSEDRRFNLIDPAGNRLMIGQKRAAAHPVPGDSGVAAQASRFASGYDTAYRLAYAKDAPEDAARVLDLVFAKNGETAGVLRYKACVLRADLAVSLRETSTAIAYRDEANLLRMALSAQELEEAKEATERLNGLAEIADGGYAE